jgi:hypothetical protein
LHSHENRQTLQALDPLGKAGVVRDGLRLPRVHRQPVLNASPLRLIYALVLFLLAVWAFRRLGMECVTLPIAPAPQ